jgi:folate-dependent tRNA-U54 methylase TrmFO/GidA
MSNLERAPESTGVNLDRNLPFESGVEYNKEHYYRMIGENGYDDFIDTGLIRAKEESKQDYDTAYFFKGAPIERYSNKQSRVQYFVEVRPSEGLFSANEAGYPSSTRPVSSNDEIRIYRHSVSDGVEVVFDSFSE